VVAWMLTAQMAAHTALGAAGADPHAGAAGSLALHVMLAVVAAVLIRRVELRIATVQAAGRAPLSEVTPELPHPSFGDIPRTLRLAADALGRAPPRIS
jgi:hypothetical protein